MQEDVGQDDVEGEEVNDPELQVKGKSISPNKKVNKICPIKPMKMYGKKRKSLKPKLGCIFLCTLSLTVVKDKCLARCTCLESAATLLVWVLLLILIKKIYVNYSKHI